MWDEELFPGVTLEDVAAEAAASFFPPMAGGAPGVLSQFEDAWSWAKGSVIDPVASFLGGVVGSLAKAVLAAIGGLLSIMGWWMYKYTDGALRTGTLLSWRLLFPHPDIVKGLSPWYYWHKVMRMVRQSVVLRVRAYAHWLYDRLIGARNWLEGRLNAWSKWVRDRVNAARNYLYDRVTALAYWVRDRVIEARNWIEGRLNAWSKWVRDRVNAARNYLYDRVTALAYWVRDRVIEARNWLEGRLRAWSSWVRDRVSEVVGPVWDWVWDAASWVGGQFTAAFEFVKTEVPRVVMAGAQAIGDAIRAAFEWLIQNAFEPFVDVVKVKLAIPGKLMRGEYASLEALIEDMMDPPDELLKGISGVFMLPFIVIGLLVNMVTGLSGPLLEPILQEQRRGVGARIPPFAMLRDGFLRGLIAEGAHDEWLGRSGFEAANITLQKALYEEIPGPTDLVRMGVREVFTPEIAERFGQFEDFPPAFGEWMEKQGFTVEWARRFWGAHWDLPSVTQGFEMFHRGVISEEDLALLLRALDVMPFWRDNLTEIAFRVISRVDVRRMYAEGVFDQTQVERVYLDLGYKPEDAAALTEFVVRRYPRKGAESDTDLRSLTLGTIKQSYARRLIVRSEAVERVVDLDYTVDDADLIVSIWDFDFFTDPDSRSDVQPKELGAATIERAYERRLVEFNRAVTEMGELGYTPEDAKLRLQLVDLRLDEQLADLEIDVALDEYTAGLIGDAQLAARMADLNLPQARVDFLLQRAILRRQAKDKRLSLSQMKRAVAAGIMGEPEYRARLDAMGYNAPDVEVLVALDVEAV